MFGRIVGDGDNAPGNGSARAGTSPKRRSGIQTMLANFKRHLGRFPARNSIMGCLSDLAILHEARTLQGHRHFPLTIFSALAMFFESCFVCTYLSMIDMSR